MAVEAHCQSICKPYTISPIETFPGSCRAELGEAEFHKLADDTLEELQDQLDAFVDSKIADGDVSYEVRPSHKSACCWMLLLLIVLHRASSLAAQSDVHEYKLARKCALQGRRAVSL
jgi:hypothetical protein